MIDQIDSDTEEKLATETVTSSTVTEESPKKTDEEYLLVENAKNLYESEIRQGSALSPLSLTFYITNDEGDPSFPANVDLKGAFEEQKEIYDLFTSGKDSNLKPEDWKILLQSPSGWKELIHVMKNPQFGQRTLRYLEISRSIEKSRRQNDVSGSLEKTSLLIQSNLKQLNNGA